METGEKELEKVETPVSGEPPIGEPPTGEPPVGEETVLPPHLAEAVSKEEADEIPEVEQLKAKIAEYESRYAGVGDKELEIAKNPNLYFEKTADLRRAMETAIPEDKEQAVKAYLVGKGIVEEKAVDTYYKRLYAYNNAIIDNYDKELAEESETKEYEKALVEKAEVEADLEAEYEKAKTFLQTKKEAAQEEFERFNFASTSKEVSSFLEGVTATKYAIGATLKEAVLENGKEKEPALIVNGEIELAPEELELVKKIALMSLKTVGKDQYQQTFDSVMSLLNKGKIEKAIAEAAYKKGEESVRATLGKDNEALIKEIARLKKSTQETEKAKAGLMEEKAPPIVTEKGQYAGVKVK